MANSKNKSSPKKSQQAVGVDSVVGIIFSNRAKQEGEYFKRLHLEVFIDKCLEILFVQRSPKKISSPKALQVEINNLKKILIPLLKRFINKDQNVQTVIENFINRLSRVQEQLTLDADFIFNEDPAADNIDEVILCYPGFYAIATHRLAHQLYGLGIPVLARLISEISHEKTGIDINPGAKIASPFFIDHGTGVVIGETTEVGPRVKIYQGVTLGALSVKRSLRSKKRHPTIEEGCVIYANATILGGDTIIGKNTVVGGNVWITSSVGPNSQVFNKSEYTLSSRK